MVNRVSLGIVATGNCLKLGCVAGDCEHPSQVPLAESVIKYPQGTTAGESLRQVWSALSSVIQTHGITDVVVLKVVGSQFGSASELRIKMEAAIELMCAQGNVRQHSVHPNSMKNQTKKFDVVAGGAPTDILSNGKKFRSVEHEQAIMCAWCLLFGKGLAA